MSDEVTDYRKLAEALAEALEQRNLWIEGEEYRELVILRMRLSARVDSLSEELKVATARIAELEAEIERFTAHSDIERQDDKCSGHGDISNFPPVMGSGDGLGW